MAESALERSPSPRGLDVERLRCYLREHLGVSAELRVEAVGGGQSNPTFFVGDGERAWVLRKQPAGTLLPSAHAIDREYRVLQALRHTLVPVPDTVLYESDPTVLGTPFYLMERLAGRVFPDAALPGVAPVDRRAMYHSMAMTLATIHQVNYDATGLSDFGRIGGYYARQFARLTKQWQTNAVHDNPALDRLITWLEPRVQVARDTRLGHGDFRIGNLMFHPHEPCVVGVLDWELSTLAPTAADLAYSSLAWRTLPTEYGGIRDLDLTALGIPSEAEYLRWYLSASGRTDPPEALDYVFAFFRLAVIFEGISARARADVSASADAHLVEPLGRAFARRGLEIVEQPGVLSGVDAP